LEVGATGIVRPLAWRGHTVVAVEDGDGRGWAVGPVIVLLDGGSFHKGPAVQALCVRHPGSISSGFPGYPPELNPDELVWAHFKGTLANGSPKNLDELLATLCRLTKKVRKRPELIRSFITGSELPPYFVIPMSIT
jgi:transposase